MAVAASRNHTRLQLFYSWHAMCAAAGWYVELTERGFLQELDIDCGHMAAGNAPKPLQCMQCELYKSRDAYKTTQWKLRADRLCRECEDRNAAASVAHAAPVAAEAGSHSSFSPFFPTSPVLMTQTCTGDVAAELAVGPAGVMCVCVCVCVCV